MMPYEFDYFFNVMFMLVFAIVAVTFIVILVRGISEWNSNNHSPKLGVEATCVSKRTSVTHHNEPVAGYQRSTWIYTFIKYYLLCCV